MKIASCGLVNFSMLCAATSTLIVGRSTVSSQRSRWCRRLCHYMDSCSLCSPYHTHPLSSYTVACCHQFNFCYSITAGHSPLHVHDHKPISNIFDIFWKTGAEPFYTHDTHGDRPSSPRHLTKSIVSIQMFQAVFTSSGYAVFDMLIPRKVSSSPSHSSLHDNVL